MRPALVFTDEIRPVDPVWARTVKIPAEAVRAIDAWDAAPRTARVSARPRRVATMRIENAWVEAELAAGWTVAYRLAVQDGAVVVSELRIFPEEDTRPAGEPGTWSAALLGSRAPVPRGGIAAVLVRRVKIGEPQRHASEILRRGRYIAPLGDAITRLGVIAPARPIRARGGRPRKADLYFAEIARDYVRAITRGSRRPVKDIAAARGLRESAVRDAIHTARERRLLTAAHPGKRGGALTDTARAILTERRKGVIRSTTRPQTKQPRRRTSPRPQPRRR
jgi:hypothetical protein